MEKSIAIVDGTILFVVGSAALILKKERVGSGQHVIYRGVCGCCGWAHPGSPEDGFANQHLLKLYTGESYGARRIFGRTDFSLDDLVPYATEKQIRELAAINI